MKLNVKRTVLVGLAFLSISGFWQLYNYVIPLILKNTFEVSETVNGMVMAADNVLALFLLPIFGALSDKTRSRFGRRMPFIVAGTFAAAVLMMLIPVLNRKADLALFAVVLALLLIAMSVYRSPAVALMPDVTPRALRSKGNAVINLMGTLGGIMTYAIIALFSKSYFTIFALVAGVMVACVLIMIFTVPENRLVEKMKEEDPAPEEAEEKAEKGKMPRPVFRSLVFLLLSVAFWYMAYNAVETAYSRYVQYIWHVDEAVGSRMMIVTMLVATACFIPVGIISSRVGRKKVIFGGVVMMAAAFAVGFLIQSYSVAAYAVMAVIGIGWASINVNSYPMVVEMSSGSDIGKYTGYYYTFSMAAQIVTPIFSGFLFDRLPGGYRVLFPYAFAFMVLAFITMIFVRHGDNRPAPVDSKLELFDAGE